MCGSSESSNYCECQHGFLLQRIPGWPAVVRSERHDPGATSRTRAINEFSVKKDARTLPRSSRRDDFRDATASARRAAPRRAIRNPPGVRRAAPCAAGVHDRPPTATKNHAVLNSRHGRNGFDTPPAISAFPPTRQSTGACADIIHVCAGVRARSSTRAHTTHTHRHRAHARTHTNAHTCDDRVVGSDEG